MKKLLQKLARHILRDELQKLRDDKIEAEQGLQRVVDSSNVACDLMAKQVQAREAIIIEHQDKMQNVFYQEEQNLLTLLEAKAIDPTEHYYSLKLLKNIEKKLS